MGKLSIVAENLWLDHILKVATFTPTADIYLALSTADFTESGGGAAEPVGNNYSRTVVSAKFTTPAATRMISNDALITCPTASGSWGTIAYWAIFDHITAGRLLAYGSFNVGKAIGAGQTPKVAIGEIDISVPALTSPQVHGMTTFLANEMLDMTFLDGNPAYTPAAIYVALGVGLANDAGSQANECAPSNGYVRKQHEGSANWDAAADVGSATANKTAITFATASGSWGTVSDYFLVTTLTDATGDMLLYGTFDSSNAIIADDEVNIAIGALDITMS